MKTQFDRGQCQKAARVKVEPEPSPPPEFVAVPIKKEPEDQQNSDCLAEAQAEEETAYQIVVKEEREPASPGVCTTPDLYKDHTIEDELAIGPELLYCSSLGPVFYVADDAVPIKEEPEDQQSSDCLAVAQAEEETAYRIVVEEEGEPAPPAVSATADLYKDHTIKDELVIAPEVLHCSSVTPVFYVPDNAVPIQAKPEDPQNSENLTEARAQEEPAYRIVVKEASPAVSATADLYKDHTIKYELVIAPDLLHSATVTPVLRDEQLLSKREVKDKEAPEEAGQEMLGHVVSSETGAVLENTDLDRNKKVDTAKPLNCNLEYLKTHESTHSDGKPFHCNYCDYKSNKKYLVKSHEIRHTGEKPFQCDSCGYKFSRKTNLQRHTMTQTCEKPFQCSYCDYKCSKESLLRNHETKHTGEKPFQCDKCDYKSRNKTQLKNHELNHINPFQCTFCDYKSSQIAQLRKHEMTHNGFNRYKCEDCNFRCGSIGKLQKHQLTHTSKTRSQCDYCEYKCTLYKDLQRHERKHNEAKPFKCNYCDCKYFLEINLRKHERKHTGEKNLLV